MRVPRWLKLPGLLREISNELSAINMRLKHMNDELVRLTERVTAIETVGDSAIELLNGLKVALDAAIASNDPAAVQALSDRLGAQADELAAAIAANTPAEEPPVE